MLYLFNTGARPEYVKNVLNTLHLPSGAINKYQYEGDPQNYAEGSACSTPIGEKVVISFVDRHDDEPEKNKYIPLRFGILKKYENKQGKSYFYVELKGFVSTFENFDSELKSSFKSKLFYKEKGTEHGYLAFSGKEIVSVQNDGNSEGWIDVVRRVMECTNLLESNCVYTHFTICNKKDDVILPACEDDRWQYTLKRNETYSINIDYYIPFAEEAANANTIQFELDSDSKGIIKPHTSTWGTQNSRQKCQFIDVGRKNNLLVNYSLKSSDDSREIMFSEEQVYITFEKKNWIIRALPFVLFAISAFVSTLIASMKDYSVKAQEGTNVVERFIAWIAELDAIPVCIILAVCAVLEALSLLWIKNSLPKDK